MGHPFRGDRLVKFWSKVDVRGPDECWVWIRARYHDGYGCVAVQGTRRSTMRASAFALMLATGEDPGGRWALHSCDNPPCCNPAHLRWGSQGENMADLDSRDRRVRGAASGERHASAKLTEGDVRDIRAAHAAGVTQARLGLHYGVTQVAVSALVRRKSWSHVL